MRSPTTLALILFAALPGAALAQEGYYDGAGRWVEIVPPPPGYYDGPPVFYEEPPPAYYEPPPEYYEAPSAYAEPGWGRRIVVVPPEDVPGGRPLRPLRRDELPPEWRDDPGGVAIAPDGTALVPPEEVLGDRPVTRRLEERRRDAVRAPELDLPAARAPDMEPPPADGPVFRQAPQPAEDFAVRPSRGWGAALDALRVYAPAKKAAVALQDDYARLAAVKEANVWLVSASTQPAGSATIRALDKILGIPATPETTALPGAGAEVTRPKAKDGGGFGGALERIGDYAAIKADALRAGDQDRRAIEQEAAKLLSEGGRTELDRDEIAGLDLYLGLGDDAARVAARTDGDPAASTE